MAKAASEITQEEAEKQIVKKFAAMREEKQKVAQKISELTQEKGEHKMVVDTLTPMDPNRKAWRLVGGVLVERTCGEVLPAVKEALAEIENVLATLQKSYDEKETEINEFMEKYNIRLQVMPSQLFAAPPELLCEQGQPPPEAKAPETE